MDKYIVISDPIRSKEFAIIGEVDGSVMFKAFNEVAKAWVLENSGIKSLEQVSIPSGMHVSSPKRMTTSMSVLLESQKLENDEIQVSKVKSRNIFSSRKINSIKNNRKNISTLPIWKIDISSKIKCVDYKAAYFINRSKRSSVMSVMRSGSAKLDSKSATFVSRSNESIDSLSKTAGYGFTRRLAVSNFIKGMPNRLNRRAENLSNMASEESAKRKCIDTAISSKAQRFC